MVAFATKIANTGRLRDLQTQNWAPLSLQKGSCLSGKPICGGRGAWGEGWMLRLLTYYSYITPWLVHWKKIAGIIKKNSSYFLSTPKLVCYEDLMALHEEAVRPWTCNDPCFHTEHMDFSAGVCLDRAHCQLRFKHPWASRKAKAYFNILLLKKSSQFLLFCIYGTLPIVLFYNWTHPCRCRMLSRDRTIYM